MRLLTGARLGPYEIVAAIGVGGMGEVYKARDPRLQRTVAIKVLPEHVAGDPDLRQRLEREARAVAALNHPHICTLYDIGEAPVGTQPTGLGSGKAPAASHTSVQFLVMEFLDGETLAARIAREPLPIDQALTLAMQVASALDAAHRVGITHRDLKPGNIMLVKANAKLLDFGLAKTVDRGVRLHRDATALPTDEPSLTAEGTILGTFEYMAPEQLEGRHADARSDIFAFGAVVYEMLTGRKAFTGKSQASLISAIMSAQPPAMATLRPLTPPTLDRIVTTCLAKDPDDRWQSARDLLRELKWIAEGASQSGAPLPGLGESGLRPARAGAWKLVASLASLLALALAWPAALHLRRTAPAPLTTRLDVVTPQTNDPLSFALSPDGRQLAFVGNADNVARLWLRSLDQVAARPLSGSDGATFPFWSPDSRSIGFFADGKLKRIDVAGGASQVLADAPGARGGAWNREGVILFAPNSNAGLMRVAAAGGASSEVTRLKSNSNGHRWPQFLPDGHRFLFFDMAADANIQGVSIGSLDGGEPTRLLPADTQAAYAPPDHLLFVSEGVLIARRFDAATGSVGAELVSVADTVSSDPGIYRGAFSVSDTGVLAHRVGGAAKRSLVWVDRDGNALGNLQPPDDTSLSSPQLAPDGRRAMVGRSKAPNSDLWLIDVTRGNTSRFTFDPRLDNNAVWSPDGSRVAFASSRNGKFDLFEKPASSATDERPLLVTDRDKSPLDWSPDGKTVLYAVQHPQNGSDLWALPLEDAAAPFPVVESAFDDVQGQFSPDGRWVVYASNETGRYQVYVKPFAGPGGRVPVSTTGGIYPRWRHDGRELFYVAADGRMMAVPISVILKANVPEAEAGAPAALFQTRLATGGGIFAGGFRSRAQYAVAADGRFLLNVAADEGTAQQITVVLNWDAALRK